VAHGDDSDFLEVIRGELGQKLELDSVLVKCLLVLTQTETVEPGRDVHAHLPFAVPAASGKPTANRDAWRMGSAGCRPRIGTLPASRLRETRLFDRGLGNVGLR